MIVHVSYTALYSEGYKGTVEGKIADNIKSYANDPGLLRMFSLRHEFPDDYHRLLASSEVLQMVDFEIRQHHFPSFLRGYGLLMSEVVVYVRRSVADPLGVSELTVNGEMVAWETDDIEKMQHGTITSLKGTSWAYGPLPMAWETLARKSWRIS